MTAFTVTTAKNIDELTSKAGGDTYAINGGTLTIDQDSRYGLNAVAGSATASTTLGSITISSTLGGKVVVDARYVRLIPFTSDGATVVPAAGVVVSQGSVTGKLIGVWSAINVAPTAAGAAMPTSGFLKVKQVSQVPGYSAGALTLAGSTWAGTVASGADVAGWIEVVGDDASSVSVPRLGTFSALGDWFEVGQTTGVNTSAYQLPTSGGTAYFPGVWVAGEFYPCAGTLVAAGSIGTDAVRGKVCWISTAGVLRFGHDGTNADTGYIPVAGLAIRLPNIILQGCLTTARNVNSANTTLTSRYAFSTTGGGVVTMDKVCSCWCMSFTRAYVVNLSYVGLLDRIVLNTMLAAITWSQVGVGQTAALTAVTLELTGCSAGGTLTNCCFARANQTSNWNVCELNDIANFTFSYTRVFSFVTRGTTSTYGIYITRCRDSVFSDTTLGGTGMFFTGCSQIDVLRTVFFDVIKGATTTSAPNNVFAFGATNSDLLFDGLTFGGLTNVHPYTWLVGVLNVNNVRLVFQNFGSYSSPLSLGSANICAGMTSLYGYDGDLAFRRIYLSAARSGGIDVGSYTNQGIALQNVKFGYADTPSLIARDVQIKGVSASAFDAAASSLVGTVFADGFTSATAGQILFRGNEPSSLNASYVTCANGAAFTGAGAFTMPTVGMSITWELPYYALGHTALVSAYINGYGTYTAGMTPYDLTFCVDKNDGAGFSSELPATAANLAAVTGIDASKGVKLRLKITTNTANSGAPYSVKIITASTSDAQAYQYPLEVATVAVNGLATGSMVKASKVSDGTILFTGMESGGAVSFATDYSGDVAIEARKASASPYYRPWQSQVTTVLGSTVSATAVQQLDE